MRIGIMLRHVAERGGTAEYTRQLIAGLGRVAPEHDYLFAFASEADLERYGPAYGRSIVVRAPSRLLWDHLAVPQAMRREGVEAILNPKHSIPLLTRIPRVFVVHGADWIVFAHGFNLTDRLYHSVFLPLYMRAASRIITISNTSAGHLSDYMPRAADKLSVVYHGLPASFAPVTDPAVLAAFRERHALPERFVTYVGQVYPPKNVGGILRAMALLRGRIPHKLVLAGKPHIKAEQDLRLIRELGLEDRVVQIGWVPHEELPTLYGLADALVFPSLFDGFGLPLAEAMACGCPVLTSTAGACPEIVGDAGLCVDPTRPEAIADGIATLVTDPALAAELRRRGLDRARAFSWDRTARETVTLLEAAARPRRGQVFASEAA